MARRNFLTLGREPLTAVDLEGAFVDVEDKIATGGNNGGAPALHAANHQHGGTDEIATATPGANKIPKAGASGTLALEWLPDATTTTKGATIFAASGNATAGRAVLATDSRLSDARTPLVHSHTAAQISDFTAAWAAAAAGAGGDALRARANHSGTQAISTVTGLQDALDAKATKTAFGASGSAHSAGLVPDPGAAAGTTRYLREDGTFAVPPGGTATAGTNGTNGTDGKNGWAPVLAVISDGERRVLQLSSWTGGTGSAPASGSFLGATGLVAAIADASDVRGAAGAAGSGGTGSGASNSALSIDVSSVASPLALSAAQAANDTLIFTGTRTVALDVSSPVAGNWVFENRTGQAVRLLAAAGSTKKATLLNGEARLVVTDLNTVYYSAALSSPSIPLANLRLYLANGTGISAATWADQSGQGNAATLTNGAAPGSLAGLSGVAFDGVNDYAAIASIFNLVATNSTVVVRANFTGTQFGALLKNGGASNGFALGVSANTLETVATGNKLCALYDGVVHIPTGITIGTGIRTIAMVIGASSTAPKFFVDGVLVYTANTSNMIAPTGTASRVGGYVDGSTNRYFGGTIYDVLVYSDAKSDADVLAIHQNL